MRCAGRRFKIFDAGWETPTQGVSCEVGDVLLRVQRASLQPSVRAELHSSIALCWASRLSAEVAQPETLRSAASAPCGLLKAVCKNARLAALGEGAHRFLLRAGPVVLALRPSGACVFVTVSDGAPGNLLRWRGRTRRALRRCVGVPNRAERRREGALPAAGLGALRQRSLLGIRLGVGIPPGDKIALRRDRAAYPVEAVQGGVRCVSRVAPNRYIKIRNSAIKRTLGLITQSRMRFPPDRATTSKGRQPLPNRGVRANRRPRQAAPVWPDACMTGAGFFI